MKILIAPDKFKGSLSGKEVCQAIQQGFARYDPTIKTIAHPLADGGDGSLEVLSEYLSFEKVTVDTLDPLGRPIKASYFTNENTAYVELPSASGLVLLKDEERNPTNTSTIGTGILIKDALKKGFNKICLFLGGSATNDAGIGIARALGYSFINKENSIIDPIGKNLLEIEDYKFNGPRSTLSVSFTILCDVKNTMYGPNGAAYTFAKQKGANTTEVEHLDAGLQKFASVVLKKTQKDISTIVGGGAAGGIAAGLSGLFNCQIKSGIQEILTLTNFENVARGVDMIISGEGKVDQTSLNGKVISALSSYTKTHAIPLHLFVGQSDLMPEEGSPIKSIHAIASVEKDINKAMKNGYGILENLAYEFIKNIHQ